MDASTNSINWFEIPVTDMKRAKHFYQVIFSIHMDETEMMGMQMAFFPYEMGSGKASGALVQGGQRMPGDKGALIYLNANPSMDVILELIPQMGGIVLMPKTQISPEVGYIALFTDTEGNKLGLHSQN